MSIKNILKSQQQLVDTKWPAMSMNVTVTILFVIWLVVSVPENKKFQIELKFCFSFLLRHMDPGILPIWKIPGWENSWTLTFCVTFWLHSSKKPSLGSIRSNHWSSNLVQTLRWAHPLITHFSLINDLIFMWFMPFWLWEIKYCYAKIVLGFWKYLCWKYPPMGAQSSWCEWLSQGSGISPSFGLPQPLRATAFSMGLVWAGNMCLWTLLHPLPSAMWEL